MTLSRRNALQAAAMAAAAASSAAVAARSTQAARAPGQARLHRGFVDLPYGQMHFRARMPGWNDARGAAAERAPLLMLHGFPSSSWALQPFIEELGRARRTWAPDLPGMGDSSPHPAAQPSLQDLADSVLQAADAWELRRFDLYGTLTGARVAVELALRAPERVRRLILDEPGGLPHTDPDFMTRYIPDLAPDAAGSQFQRAFNFCRDAYVWFPWYRQTLANQRNFIDMPQPAALHGKTMEILKSAQLPAVFRSSVRYDVAARAPLLRLPTLTTDELARIIPGARSLGLPRIEATNATPEQVAARVSAFRDFLDEA